MLSGCSSFYTHTRFGHYNDGGSGEFGHPYSGTQMALANHPCHLGQSAALLFIPYPFFLVDLALTPVFDTLFLPADILFYLNADQTRNEVVDTSPCTS